MRIVLGQDHEGDVELVHDISITNGEDIEKAKGILKLGFYKPKANSFYFACVDNGDNKPIHMGAFNSLVRKFV